LQFFLGGPQYAVISYAVISYAVRRRSLNGLGTMPILKNNFSKIQGSTINAVRLAQKLTLSLNVTPDIHDVHVPGSHDLALSRFDRF
jgi:hypothetical protein